jgi:hypothetical protein
MTLDRRLTKVDQTLSPTQLVLRWLAEAHAYGALEPYVASLLAPDQPEAPLDRLAREAVQRARTATRGKRPELVDAAVRSALRETIFRYELALRINVVAHELLDREQLLATLFASQLALLLSERDGKHSPDDSHLRRLEQCRRLTRLRVDELVASQEARSMAEARYLDGHAALFPDISAAFKKQLQDSQDVAAMAVRAAGFAGIKPTAKEDPDAVKVRAGELVADLVEPARSEALEKCGEGRQAFDVAAGWVRGKITPRATSEPADL